ncbi:MAG: ISL3 family transposase [Woronichinia naegeliana WA131]|uniref:ISL3 family transposase n=1 Tax=Woronichinia naegeliana WA131 TaxID=2824559 RepID=A0A977KY21_9CYAN|nr:MAG: ISL3 family transposase [Woronichinia naegeliana WA131]UXE62053.1 MAG: ISL3 family transposase [Woronichinia naegeliana WA131]
MWINLDELLGLPKVTVVNYREIDGALFLKLKMKNEVMECPNCHKELEDINQIEYNLVRDLSLLGKKVYLEVPRRQFHCEKCQKYITERLDFMQLRKHYTIRYEEKIYEQVKKKNVEEVRQEEEISWGTLESIFEEYAKQAEKKEWELPEKISLDEFSNRKGKKDFITTVIDINKKELLEVIKGHKKEEIIEALKVQPARVRENVKEVSVDMWEGFTSAIKELFVNAKIVYDRFHVMKNINEELNKLRKKMNMHKKGLTYLLWKNKEELKEEKREELEEILKMYPCLGIAYEMKEEIRDIYEHSRTTNGARRKFEKWMRTASLFYKKSVGMLKTHLTGICNYFENHTTNGLTEGMNTKIKLIKRKSYGFANFEHLRLKLLACFNS